MADMICKGYWVVLPYHLVRHLPNLRISPMGALPQRERRPHIIVDYSFSNVNQEADKGAPPEAMQFGRTLNRVLHRIATADPADSPVSLMKLDLSDVFYRVYRIPSTTPGAEPPRDARDSGSARSHSMHLETSSSDRP